MSHVREQGGSLIIQQSFIEEAKIRLRSWLDSLVNEGIKQSSKDYIHLTILYLEKQNWPKIAQTVYESKTAVALLGVYFILELVFDLLPRID